MEANCSIHGMLNISRGIISKSVISITLFPCNSLITKKKSKRTKFLRANKTSSSESITFLSLCFQKLFLIM